MEQGKEKEQKSRKRSGRRSVDYSGRENKGCG